MIKEKVSTRGIFAKLYIYFMVLTSHEKGGASVLLSVFGSRLSCQESNLKQASYLTLL